MMMQSMLSRLSSVLLFAGLAYCETISVTGLKKPVEILVDKWGVPHIYAGNAADAYFGQGFNVARDRQSALTAPAPPTTTSSGTWRD